MDTFGLPFFLTLTRQRTSPCPEVRYCCCRVLEDVLFSSSFGALSKSFRGVCLLLCFCTCQPSTGVV